ncbi:MAG: thermonuclease family protein, partial [Actinomycetota bacterium]|nr:thermonuclease family protein [Actinomycetota bacterium]
AASIGLVLGACGDAAPGSAPAPGEATGTVPAGIDFTVERVVDGDTIVVSGGRTVRLIGVDTPETKDPRRPVECFGREASGFTASLVPRGARVRLVGDVEQRDRYDRTLAYVYRLPDGLFVNAELLRRGYAQVLTIAPNVAHAEEFRALAGQARAAGAGLWAACDHPDR